MPLPPEASEAELQIRIAILEVFRQSQREWIAASEDLRDAARQRFMQALNALFVLCDRPPRN
jgi:hypothetical protein